MSVKLSPRLLSAVGFVRPCRMLADIGTDHAYLPIYLCQNGYLSANENKPVAVASDINEGPVERASLHIRTSGLSDKIITVRTDGLTGLDKYAPEDIIIFGMGGELIASILEDAPWVCAKGIRLILQPMTHAEKLCSALLELGFAITDEIVSIEGDRVYRTICADYSPELVSSEKGLSGAEMLIGSSKLARSPEQYELYIKLAKKHISSAKACRSAKLSAGVDTSAEDLLISELEAIIGSELPT